MICMQLAETGAFTILRAAGTASIKFCHNNIASVSWQALYYSAEPVEPVGPVGPGGPIGYEYRKTA
jgi:hypothetical protein